MSGAAGNQRGVNQMIFCESIVVGQRGQVQPRDHRQIGAQHIPPPDSTRKQAGVHELVDLGANLTVTPQHVFSILINPLIVRKGNQSACEFNF